MTKWQQWFSTFSILIAWATLVTSASISPAMAQAQTPIPVNLLNNPGLEPQSGCSHWRGINELQVAPGWTPWWLAGSPEQVGRGELFRPEYRCLSSEQFGAYYVHQGGHSQKLFTRFATHEAGLYQQLMIPPGSTATFTAWSLAWSSGDDDPYHSAGGRYITQIGIDPTGATDPEGDEIVWSDPQETMDTWLEHQVETATESGFVTVWLRGRTWWGMSHNDAYWDDASLTISALLEPTVTPSMKPLTASPSPEPSRTLSPADVSPANPRGVGETTPSPSTTRTTTTLSPTALRISTPTIPGSSPTPTPAATRSALTGKTLGTLCLTIFQDQNGNRVREDSEPVLADALVSWTTQHSLQASTQRPASGGTETDETGVYTQALLVIGPEQPRCWAGLSPGKYQVRVRSEIGNREYEKNIQMIQGNTSVVEFPVEFPAGDQTRPDDEETSIPTLRRQGIAAFAVILGALVAFSISRSRWPGRTPK